ncbi:MAG: DUF1588 domain-containing protein [Vicinamibacterales bacterium]
MADTRTAYTRWVRRASCAAVAALVGATLHAQAPTGEQQVTGMRRLTQEQYRNAVADVFGDDIQIAGRIDPIVRPPHGLQIMDVSRIAVSLSGGEEYNRMALAIANQVVDEKHRGALVVCKPRDAAAADDECAAKFFLRVGKLIMRKPFALKDVQAQVAAAGSATRLTKDFYSGLALSLATMLQSPEFLFDMDFVEPDPTRPGSTRLSGFSKATRLSLFFWNTTPDAMLLDAGGRGDLHTKAGLAKQVDRLLASPRLETGVRAFFGDVLGFDAIGDLAKDTVIYPQFNQDVKRDMPEQTMRTLVDLLVTRNGDYRDLFTTRDTFLTRGLGAVYGVPVEQATGWAKHQFAADSPRIGLLTQMSFLATHSHDGRSSPTLRGKALRELILCQAIPDPPANVNFTLVNDTKNEKLKTVRDRLTVHRENPACSTCHRRMDPVGLSLENFDGVGAFRSHENGVLIDTSGELDGSKFDSPATLGQAVHDNPGVPACLAKRATEYAVRRPLTPGEAPWLKAVQTRFGSNGYKLRALLRDIATSEQFFGTASSTATPAKAPGVVKAVGTTKEVTK